MRPYRLVRTTILAATFAAMVSACGEGTETTGTTSGPHDEPSFSHVCEVRLAASTRSGTPARYAELGLDVSFLPENGTFLAPDAVRCRSNRGPFYDHFVDGSTAPAGYRSNLFLNFDEDAGTELPAELAACTFLARRELTSEDFWAYVQTDELLSETDDESEPEATVAVTCAPFADWQPYATTTTTLAPGCMTASCLDDSHACIDDACTLGTRATMELVLADADDTIGAMLVELDYERAGMAFLHAGGPGFCLPNPELDMLYADCNAAEDGSCGFSLLFHPGEARIGVVALNGIDAPVVLATCEIIAEDPQAAIEALRVRIPDASSLEFEQIGVTLEARLLQ